MRAVHTMRAAAAGAVGALALAGCYPDAPEGQAGAEAQAEAAPEPAPEAAQDAEARRFSEAELDRLATLDDRMDALEVQVTRNDDVSAIKTLTRSYSYYLDRGLWDDLAALMTGDVVGVYPAGTFIGRDSLRAHFLDNIGRGRIGLDEGRLGNHIALQPLITVAPDGRTAEGRWRALAQLGQYGETADWAGGVYEIDYRKEGGRWLISGLRYYGVFSAPYEGGWANAQAGAEDDASDRFADLPHPPDAAAPDDCPQFPERVCVPPFHYANPATGADWPGLETYRERLGAREAMADGAAISQELTDE